MPHRTRPVVLALRSIAASAGVALLALLPSLAAFAHPAGAQQSSAGFAPALRITAQTSGTRQLIQAVHAVSDRVVWASGHGGVVLRTRDGGDSWQRLVVPDADSLEFRDVHATSADSAWILAAGAGARSRIYRTTDGGATWQLQFRNADTSAFYDCLTFLDARRGIAYSDASAGRTLILRTTDGGGTWTLLPPDRVPPPLPGEGAFAASGQCVAAAGPSSVLIATGTPGARLFRSTDAGEHFTAQGTPFVRGAVAGLTGLAFQDADRGIAVAADIDRLRTDTSSAVVGVTNDGGRTWTLRARPPLPGALAGVAWVPAVGSETAVVVGFGGAFVTSNAARSWRTISDQLFTGVSAFGRTAWIAGGGGRITRLDW
jgi:photosystem II stability/assembly factor-like uncharacterized protein